MYIYSIRPDEIYHYGMPERSGRYPWGSGNRPKQRLEGLRKQHKERLRKKNIEVGEERLKNRIKRANELEDVDRFSKKVGWDNTKKAAAAHKQVKEIKNVSSEILSDEDRTAKLGGYTRKVRALDIGITSSAATSLAITGTTFVTGFLDLPIAAVALPLIGSGAIIGLGMEYFKKTKY